MVVLVCLFSFHCLCHHHLEACRLVCIVVYFLVRAVTMFISTFQVSRFFAGFIKSKNCQIVE